VVGLRDFPEEPVAGEKFDHYSGRLYVKINAELAAEKALRARLEELEGEPAARDEVDEVGFNEVKSINARLTNIERLKARIVDAMHALERGECHGLITQILNAQLETAYRLGIYYNLLNWESHLVQSHMFSDAMRRIQEAPKVYQARSGRYEGTLVIEPAQPPAGGGRPGDSGRVRQSAGGKAGDNDVARVAGVRPDATPARDSRLGRDLAGAELTP